MSSDARLSTGLPGHPKTKKLIRRLGPAAGWSLVCLILWARDNRPDGDLTGMTGEDIELAADWTGENDALVRELAAVGFLDGEEGGYQLHDWADHQPWSAGSEARSDRAKWSALCRRHGREEAARLMPEYAAKLAKSSDSSAKSAAESANSSDVADDTAAKAGKLPAPSPIPSPSPSPIPSPKAKASSLRSDSTSPTDEPDEPDPVGEGGNVHQHPADRVSVVVLTAYHDLLPNCRRIAVLNPKRRKRIQLADKLARQVCRSQGWDYDAEAFWRAYFGQCLQDPWLRGDVPNPRNPDWKQNLDVLLAEDRFAQIMDRAISRMEAAA